MGGTYFSCTFQSYQKVYHFESLLFRCVYKLIKAREFEVCIAKLNKSDAFNIKVVILIVKHGFCCSSNHWKEEGF